MPAGATHADVRSWGSCKGATYRFGAVGGQMNGGSDGAGGSDGIVKRLPGDGMQGGLARRPMRGEVWRTDAGFYRVRSWGNGAFVPYHCLLMVRVGVGHGGGIAGLHQSGVTGRKEAGCLGLLHEDMSMQKHRRWPATCHEMFNFDEWLEVCTANRKNWPGLCL